MVIEYPYMSPPDLKDRDDCHIVKISIRNGFTNRGNHLIERVGYLDNKYVSRRGYIFFIPSTSEKPLDEWRDDLIKKYLSKKRKRKNETHDEFLKRMEFDHIGTQVRLNLFVWNKEHEGWYQTQQ